MSEGQQRVARIGAAALVVVVVLGLVLHQMYLSRAMPISPYMDTLRVIALLDGWEHGRVELAQLWGVGSAHQGLIHEALIYLNVKLLDYDALAANRATGGVVALVAVVLGASVLRWLRDVRQVEGSVAWMAVLFAAVVVPVLVFSWNGFEVFTLDLGLSLWLKNLGVVLAMVGYQHLLSAELAGSRWGWRRLAVLCVGCISLILLVTMGWSFALAGALLVQLVASGALWRLAGASRRRAVLPVVAAWLALFVYVWMSTLSAKGELVGNVVRPGLMELSSMMAGALGSSLLGLEAARADAVPVPWIVIMGWALLALGAMVMAAFALRRRWPSTTLPLAFMAYAGATAVALSIGRAMHGVEGVMASRYYMDVVLFPIGLAWLWLDLAVSQKWRLRPVVLGLCCMFLLVQLVMQMLAYRQEWKAAPYRKAVFDAMASALEQHVPNDSDAALLQAPLADARAASEVMRREGLGPFKDDEPMPCSADAIEYGNGWYGLEGQSRWMAGSAMLTVPGCPCQLQLSTYLPADFPERTLTLIMDGMPAQTTTLVPGMGQDVRLQLGEVSHRVELKAGLTTSPAQLGESADTRELGVLIAGTSISCPLEPRQ